MQTIPDARLASIIDTVFDQMDTDYDGFITWVESKAKNGVATLPE